MPHVYNALKAAERLIGRDIETSTIKGPNEFIEPRLEASFSNLLSCATANTAKAITKLYTISVSSYKGTRVYLIQVFDDEVAHEYIVAIKPLFIYSN